MTGGGELAAVFQARRSGGTTKKAEVTVESTTSSSSSGELAAILQARKKIANGDSGSSNTMTPPRPTAVAATTPLASPSSVVAPSTISTPKAKSTPKFPLSSPNTSTTPSTTTTPLTSASPVRNKTLTATFESRDLEVGIPTPGFLQDVRKNLKRPGEKKIVANLPAATATTAAKGGVASGGSATAEKVKQTIVQEQRDEGEGGLASSSSSSTKTSSTRDQSHQDLMASRRSRMVASRSAKSDNSVGGGTPTNKINVNNNNNAFRSPAKSDNSIGGGGTPTNKTAKSNILSINASTQSSGTSSVGGTPAAPVTPASARREKLRAKIRASSSTNRFRNNNGLQILQTDLSADDVSSSGKIIISSPTKDEFEMSFFDANHPPGPAIPDLDRTNIGNDQRQKIIKKVQQTNHFELRTDSIDSIYKDLHATSTGSTLKTANNSSLSSGFRDRDCHRASTPKICGSQHSEYDEKDVYEEKKYSMVGGVGTHRRESSHGSSDPYNHLQPYAVTRSPSQGSQMSAITTPSCFPQDHVVAYPTASGGQHGVNKPILEAIDSFGNSASGSTPTSKSTNEEMIHLREQMKEFKQKLAEKDAIISQLMKRISDLEQSNPLGKVVVGGGYQQQPPPRSSFGTDDNASAFSTPNPVVSLSSKTSNKGGHPVGRKPFNNLASQSVQSIVRSTERKKFVC
mmetsp:Transcript_37791/g.77325  ORF Transcript_37791/g.77325 Transcript_37791/m.77325 type:complete len:685 (-) Transcript_37791:167-2221(-)